jgi:hypothetical protein
VLNLPHLTRRVYPRDSRVANPFSRNSLVTKVDGVNLLVRSVFLSIAITVFASSIADGDETLSGSQLRELCSSSRNSLEDAACFTYIQGFIDGVEEGNGSKPKGNKPWCLPEAATVSQARLVVEKYMQDNPAILDRRAGSIVALALTRAFPCPSSK